MAVQTMFAIAQKRLIQTLVLPFICFNKKIKNKYLKEFRCKVSVLLLHCLVNNDEKAPPRQAYSRHHAPARLYKERVTSPFSTFKVLPGSIAPKKGGCHRVTRQPPGVWWSRWCYFSRVSSMVTLNEVMPSSISLISRFTISTSSGLSSFALSRYLFSAISDSLSVVSRRFSPL